MADIVDHYIRGVSIGFSWTTLFWGCFGLKTPLHEGISMKPFFLRTLCGFFVSLPFAFQVNAQEIDGRSLQYMLNDIGYDVGGIDGVVGQKTLLAIHAALPEFEFDQVTLHAYTEIKNQFLSKNATYSPETSQDRKAANSCRLKTHGTASLLFAHHELLEAKGIMYYGEAPNNPWFSDAYAIADLNADGKLDIINPIHSMNSPNLNLPVFIWSEGIDSVKGVRPWGIGKQFGLQIDQKLIDGIPVADFNGDGVDDFALVEYGEHDHVNHREKMGGSVYVSLSSPSGQYATHDLQTAGNFWHRGVSLDVNYDGFEDIVVAGSPNTNSGNWVYALLNDGAGNFTQKPFLRGNMFGTWAVSAGDIDSDGFADIIVGSQGSGRNSGIKIFWGGSDYMKSEAIAFSHSAKDTFLDFSFGDYDGDGGNDIAVITARENYSWNEISIITLDGRAKKDDFLLQKITPGWVSGVTYPQGMGGSVQYIFNCNERVTALMLAQNAGFTDYGNLIKD